MSNRSLIIMLIIMLTILIIGLVAFLYLALSHNFKFNNWGGKKSEQIIFDENYETETIENLEILSTAGDIKLEESTDGEIRVVVYGENAEDLKVNVEENKLKVDYSQRKRKNMFFGFGYSINDIFIYLPKDYAKTIEVKTNYGDIDAIDLENATLMIEEDCGDVTLGKVQNVSIKNHYGDIKIDAIGNRIWAESDCGDVKINSVTLAEESVIRNNLGDIKIGQTNEIFIDAKTDLGDVKVNHNNRHAEITLVIENSCGDIKVEN